jgi:Tetratricopeptide repeat
MSAATSGVAVVVAVFVVVVGSPAVGQPPPSREDEASARLHFDRGSRLYDQGKYLEAAREFEAGYQAAPRPLFLLNIGHSYRRAQDLRKAKAAYEKLLRTDPTTPQRPMVEDLIKTIDDALTVQELAIPLSPAAPARPGPNGAAPAQPGQEAAAAPAVDLAAVPVPPPPAPSSSSWLRSPWLWGIVAGVVTAGVAGTVFAVTRSPSCPANTCWKEP